MKRDIQILTGQVLAADCRKTIAQATPRELYNAVSKAALDLAADAWKRAPGKRVAYLSAEFLVGRLVYANLLNMGRLGEVQQMLLDAGVDANVFEEIEDAALGNGAFLQIPRNPTSLESVWSAKAHITPFLSKVLS